MPTTQQIAAAAARRADVASAYIRGETQVALAQRLGVTQQQISLDLKAIQAAWLQSSLRDFDALKSEQLAKVDAVERAAWEGYERSCQPRETTLTERNEGGEWLLANGTTQARSPTRKATVRREGQVGDPRFLERIQKCIDQRCSIWGLGAEQDALKHLGLGMAALLTEAQQWQVAPPPPPPGPPVPAGPLIETA